MNILGVHYLENCFRATVSLIQTFTLITYYVRLQAHFFIILVPDMSFKTNSKLFKEGHVFLQHSGEENAVISKNCGFVMTAGKKCFC